MGKGEMTWAFGRGPEVGAGGGPEGGVAPQRERAVASTVFGLAPRGSITEFYRRSEVIVCF